MSLICCVILAVFCRSEAFISFYVFSTKIFLVFKACTDNSEYKFNGIKKFTCKWVSRLPYDRCSLVDKARSLVAKNCPESCGLCASVSIIA